MQSGGSALDLILAGDPALFAIVWLSLIVSLSAVFMAALIGMPVGALLAGALAPPLGEQLTVALCALVGLAFAAFVWWKVPQLRAAE